MQPMEAEIGRMEEQLSQWGARLDELIAKFGNAGATATHNTKRRLDVLRAKHQDATWKLAELRSLASESRESIKAGVESAWDELEVAFRELSIKPQRGRKPKSPITYNQGSAGAGEKSSFPQDDSRDVVE